MSIVTATNLVPREQHLGLFLSLWGMRSELSNCILVGERLRSPAVDFVITELEQELSMYSYHSIEGIEPLGRARRVLLEKAALWAENHADLVLFLDDDCFMTVDELRAMVARTDANAGCVILQSDYRGNPEALRGRPAFDFTCTLVPAEYIALLLNDTTFLDLIERMNKGAEFLVMDWWLRQRGCFLNVLPRYVMHVKIEDERRIWADRTQEEWDELYDDILVCGSLSRLVSILTARGLV